MNLANSSPEDTATEASMLGVLYPVHIVPNVSVSTILHGVGYQVAYPGRGNARALMWDRRVEHPRLSFTLLD